VIVGLFIIEQMIESMINLIFGLLAH